MRHPHIVNRLKWQRPVELPRHTFTIDQKLEITNMPDFEDLVDRMCLSVAVAGLMSDSRVVKPDTVTGWAQNAMDWIKRKPNAKWGSRR